MVNFVSYLFYFLPISLITGPFLSDLSISLIGIFFLYISIKYKLWHYYINTFSIIFLTFYLYILILSLFADDIIHSLNYSLFYFRYLLFTLGVIYLIKSNRDFLNKTTFFFTFTYGILVFDGYFQFIFGQNIIGIPYNGYRVSSFFGDDLVMGSYLSRLMPFCFALLILNTKLTNKRISSILIGLVLADILIFLSGERTSFFLLSLATLMILLFTKNYKFIRLISFTISIVAIFLISFTSENVKERMIDRTLSQMALDQNDKHIFSVQHEQFYLSSLDMFRDKPLFGNGPGMYRKLCPEDLSIELCSTHPHNNYIQLLSETGIIGLLPFIIIFLLMIKNFILQGLSLINRNKKTYLSDYNVCLYTALFLSLWPFAPSMSFFNNWINIIYYIPVAFILVQSTIDFEIKNINK